MGHWVLTEPGGVTRLGVACQYDFCPTHGVALRQVLRFTKPRVQSSSVNTHPKPTTSQHFDSPFKKPLGILSKPYSVLEQTSTFLLLRVCPLFSSPFPIGAQFSPPSLASLHQPTPPERAKRARAPLRGGMKAKDERRGKAGGAKRASVASGAEGIAGGEFAPERRPSLKGVGWCRRAFPQKGTLTIAPPSGSDATYSYPWPM